MIALSTHSGDGSPAVPVIGAMEAIGPQLSIGAMAICRIRFDVT